MGGGGGGLVGGSVVWWPPPPPEVVDMVSQMYRVLDGVFVWKNRVKTQGLGLWPEPVMVTSHIF
jgi:hypothetical protein